MSLKMWLQLDAVSTSRYSDLLFKMIIIVLHLLMCGVSSTFVKKKKKKEHKELMPSKIDISESIRAKS